MKVIDGKKIAGKILADLRKEIQIRKIKPVLAVILSKNNPAAQLYLQQKERAGREIGLVVQRHRLSELDSLNKNPQIKGILIQLPLPKHFRADKVIKRISPLKDVDGLLPESRFDSPFILAIYRALLETKENLAGKKIVALVKSGIFGKKLKSFFEKRGLAVELNGRSQEAEVLITALGRPKFIKDSMIKKGVILIDGGISRINNQTIGDIDRESVKRKAAWLSPVPGGLGPLTVAFLLKNVFLATKYK